MRLSALEMPYSELNEEPSESVVGIFIDLQYIVFDFLQTYGLLLSLTIAIIAFLIRHVAKIRKNTVVQSKMFFLFFGMCLIALISALSPYLALYTFEKQDVPVEESESWILPILTVLQSYSVLLTLIVCISSITNYYLAHIRKNKRVKSTSRSLIVGAILICILFHLIPEYIIDRFSKEEV